MLQRSCAGGLINRPRTAVTISWRLRALTNWRRFSGRRSRSANASSRGLRADRFSSAFLVLRRPRCIPLAVPLLTRRKFQKAGEGPAMLVDVLMPIAQLAEARRHRGQREIGRRSVLELFPLQWGRHSRVCSGPYRIGRGNGPVFGILVIVDEHAFAFFLPPFRGGNARRKPLHFAAKRERG